MKMADSRRTFSFLFGIFAFYCLRTLRSPISVFLFRSYTLPHHFASKKVVVLAREIEEILVSVSISRAFLIWIPFLARRI